MKMTEIKLHRSKEDITNDINKVIWKYGIKEVKKAGISDIIKDYDVVVIEFKCGVEWICEVVNRNLKIKK